MELKVKTFKELSTSELYEILKARSAIFIMEQSIHYQDLDDVDYQSLHFFYQENQEVIAYLRAFYIDKEKRIVKIGRVLTMEHGKGLGRSLLEEAIPLIKDKMACTKIIVDAQKQAQGFYEKLGFRVTSGKFLEEGIIHVKMELN